MSWLRGVVGVSCAVMAVQIYNSCFVQAPVSSSLPRLGLSSQPRLASSPATNSSASNWSVLALAGVAALAGASSRKFDRKASSVVRKASLIATRMDQAVPWWERLTRPTIEPGIGIWAEKLNMTTMFQEEDGNVKTVPATILVIKKGGNMITDKRWPEKHGHYSVQVGYERYTPDQREKEGKRALQLKRLERNECPPLRKIKDFRVRPQDWEKWEIGQKIWPSDFLKEGDTVDVHGYSKGKGFVGRIRRWGGKRGPMTHGSKHHRREGSIGSAFPKRVLPSRHRAGWLGARKSIAHNLKILKIMDRIDEENMPESVIVVQGSVPGYTAHWESGGSYLWLHKAKNRSDGRFKRDPVWLWFYHKGDDVDPLVPIKEKAWTWKTMWGRDIRWITSEVKKYWPDGFPGYDHIMDPFYDDCDEHIAMKAPEW